MEAFNFLNFYAICIATIKYCSIFGEGASIIGERSLNKKEIKASYISFQVGIV